jgi:hypothetical protein
MDNENEVSTFLLSCLGLVALTAIVIVVGPPMHGWALAQLWDWFVVPIFDLPSMTVLQAYGVAMVVSLLARDFDLESHEDKSQFERWTIIIAGTIFRPLFAVLVGWIVHGLAF